MKPTDVIPLGFWIASAVKVAGYTWQAYFGSYEKFPSPQAAGGAEPHGVIQDAIYGITHPLDILKGLGDIVGIG